MNNRNMRHSMWYMTVISLIIMFLVFLVLLFGWGHNQAITPEWIQSRQDLHIGMNAKDVEYQLAVPAGFLRSHTIKSGKDGWASALASPGFFGKWIVQQNLVVMEFDVNDSLKQCYVEVNWRIDERYMRIPIQRNGK